MRKKILIAAVLVALVLGVAAPVVLADDVNASWGEVKCLFKVPPCPKKGNG